MSKAIICLAFVMQLVGCHHLLAATLHSGHLPP